MFCIAILLINSCSTHSLIGMRKTVSPDVYNLINFIIFFQNGQNPGSNISVVRFQ